MLLTMSGVKGGPGEKDGPGSNGRRRENQRVPRAIMRPLPAGSRAER